MSMTCTTKMLCDTKYDADRKIDRFDYFIMGDGLFQEEFKVVKQAEGKWVMKFMGGISCSAESSQQM